MNFQVHQGWFKFFSDNKVLLKTIMEQIEDDDYLPLQKDIFRTFKYFNLKKCKLCILGQDPYPGFSKENNETKYYAEGLAFSINPEIKKLPGSLKNIFKELKDNYPDFGYHNGSLINWVKNEKIMLLNTALTVKKGKPNSHSKYWLEFTDNVIKELDKKSNCLFLLMGNNAKNKIKIIQNKDRIITCVHPSPLSANRGFFGSKIFTKINDKLNQLNIKPINWNLKK